MLANLAFYSLFWKRTRSKEITKDKKMKKEQIEGKIIMTNKIFAQIIIPNTAATKTTTTTTTATTKTTTTATTTTTTTTLEN